VVLFQILLDGAELRDGHIKTAAIQSTLAVDGWAVTFGTASRGLVAAAAPPSPLLTLPNVIAHPSTASVAVSYYSMWHYDYLCALQC